MMNNIRLVGGGLQANTEKKYSVLIVEDDRVALHSLSTIVESLGYRVQTASNGADAYTMARENPSVADIIITDRIMPIMDGVALTRKLKRSVKTENIPIIMLTGAKASEDMATGIEAGVFYYLQKPPEHQLVKSVLESARREVSRRRILHSTLGAHQSAFNFVDVLRLTISKVNEIEPACSLLASVHNEPDKIVMGIFDLVQNAVEHGILRFGFREKHRLLSEGSWKDALYARSAACDEYNGEVEVTIIKKETKLVLTVKDSGGGFDWSQFMSVDPSRSSALCGRGIARAKTLCFDQMVYNNVGNQVTAIKELQRPFSW